MNDTLGMSKSGCSKCSSTRSLRCDGEGMPQRKGTVRAELSYQLNVTTRVFWIICFVDITHHSMLNGIQRPAHDPSCRTFPACHVWETPRGVVHHDVYDLCQREVHWLPTCTKTWRNCDSSTPRLLVRCGCSRCVWSPTK